jgi:HAMP domain-containing protein
MNEQRVGSTWLANLTIQRKLALAFASVLLIFCIACVVIVAALAEQQRAHTAQQQAVAAIDAAQNVRAAIHRLETTLYERLADDHDAAARVDTARRTVTAEFTGLVARTRDDAVLIPRALQAEQRFRDWDLRVVEPLLADIGTVPTGETRMTALHTLAQRFGEADRREGRPLEQVLADIDTAAHAQLDARVAELERAAATTRITVLGMFVFAIAVGLLAIWLARRLIVEPIRTLTGLMTRLADRDHDVAIPQQQRRDEVGAMARALDVFKRSAIDTYWQSRNKTAIGEIAALLQRCTSADEFAERFCTEVAQRVDAGVAVFFRYDDDHARLERIGGYGYRERRHLETRYALGEGLTRRLRAHPFRNRRSFAAHGRRHAAAAAGSSARCRRVRHVRTVRRATAGTARRTAADRRTEF